MSTRLGDALRGAIESTRCEEVLFAAALSPSERDEAGTHERWSAKDLLAHTAAAKARLAAALRKADQGDKPSLDHDEADVYAAHATASWPEVETLAADAVDSLLAQLAALPELRLTATSAFSWLAGRAIGPVAIGYAVTHPLTHLAEFRDEHASAEAGAETRERLIAILESIPAGLHDAGTRENLAAVRALRASG